MSIGVLCSGNLGLHILQKLYAVYPVSFVFTDSKSIVITSFCQDNNIPLFRGNPRNGNCNSFLSDKQCDILLSVNYIFLVDNDLISFPKKYAINVHGSLLPKYRGRTPHVWAIINNEKMTGITAHLIDSGCDTGNIVEQIEVEIEPSDTGASILDKFNLLYWPLIDKVLNKIKYNQLTSVTQYHAKATYFGKRTPEDGLIDWSWQKERIYNWVRAQAHPYPGAFTYINGSKLVIDSISFTDDGFRYDIPNGTVISFNPFLVKTSNGVVKIDVFRGSINEYNDKQMVLG